MRRLVDRARLREFFEEIGRATRQAAVLYVTGGATSVLKGWRASTIDVDIRLEPEVEEVFQAIPALKEKLEINVELASPIDFIPALPDWKERSEFVMQANTVAVYHFDYYAQALAKLERGHKQDLEDVQHMFRAGLIDKQKLLEYFGSIESMLPRYPAIDPDTFYQAVKRFVGS